MAANLATSAHSRYSQYGFNSFAKFGGKHYGCKSDGIYELGGETGRILSLDGDAWRDGFPARVKPLKRFERRCISALNPPGSLCQGNQRQRHGITTT